LGLFLGKESGHQLVEQIIDQWFHEALVHSLDKITMGLGNHGRSLSGGLMIEKSSRGSKIRTYPPVCNYLFL
jgi:hypothetical protein